MAEYTSSDLRQMAAAELAEALKSGLPPEYQVRVAEELRLLADSMDGRGTLKLEDLLAGSWKAEKQDEG